MSVNFTPQFFSRPAPVAPMSAPVPGSKFVATDNNAGGLKPEQKKYSMEHGIPERKNPFGPSPLSNASQRYADIDWNKKEAITQDGERHAFGSPRFSE